MSTPAAPEKPARPQARGTRPAPARVELSARRQAGHGRRRALFVTRLAAAQTPGDQVFAAANYLRAVLKRDVPPELAHKAAAEAVQALDQIVDRLLARKKGGHGE